MLETENTMIFEMFVEQLSARLFTSIRFGSMGSKMLRCPIFAPGREVREWSNLKQGSDVIGYLHTASKSINQINMYDNLSPEML
jgi:hypothetical protein